MQTPINRVLKILDGFDWDNRYQMVPEGHERGWFEIQTRDEPRDVALDPPGIAKLTLGAPSAGVVAGNNFLAALRPHTKFAFKVFGIKPGNTTLLARDPQRNIVSRIHISVKRRLPVSYSACVLRDMFRSASPWNEHNIASVMQKVKETYLDQANIWLERQPAQIFDVNLYDMDLGNPILFDGPLDVPANQTYQEIVRRTPQEATQARVILYFCWDVAGVDQQAAGVTDVVGGRICFVERSDENYSIITAAHEIGHALGLDHVHIDTLMRTGQAPTNLHLLGKEIDIINRTDVAP